MKENIRNIITIIEDVKASYHNDKFIQERLTTAATRLKELGRVEPQVMPTNDIIVYAVVEKKTGEIDGEIYKYDDEIDRKLVDGFEWRKFKLTDIGAV